MSTQWTTRYKFNSFIVKSNSLGPIKMCSDCEPFGLPRCGCPCCWIAPCMPSCLASVRVSWCFLPACACRTSSGWRPCIPGPTDQYRTVWRLAYKWPRTANQLAVLSNCETSYSTANQAGLSIACDSPVNILRTHLHIESGIPTTLTFQLVSYPPPNPATIRLVYRPP